MDDNQLMAELAHFEVNHSSGLVSSDFNPSSENSVTIQTETGEMWSLPLECNSEEDADILTEFQTEVLHEGLLSKDTVTKLSKTYFVNSSSDEYDISELMKSMCENYYDNLEDQEENEGFDVEEESDFTDEELEEFAELENKLHKKEENSVSLQKSKEEVKANIPITLTKVSLENMLAMGLIK